MSSPPIRSPPSPLTTTLLYDLPLSSPRSPPLPPSPSRSRQPASHDVESFAAQCRAWYFHQDDRAGALMTSILESLPASQRPQFSRIQATIRSAFHATLSRRRASEFRAHLSSVVPGGSLSLRARPHPHSPLAKKERHAKFQSFLRTWCTPAMPGTLPFFRALWALFRLQVLPEALGGAGPRRIQWELDDAVFQESAGKEFMLDAIDVLKGVLGFEDYAPDLQPPPPPAPNNSRPRSPSDPFLDSHREHDQEDDDPIRLWTAPDLDNPELQRLISLFPDFTHQVLPRFNSTAQDSPRDDLEQAREIAAAAPVHCGTGSFWLSDKLRADGWHGSWWDRLAAWWRRLFC